MARSFGSLSLARAWAVAAIACGASLPGVASADFIGALSFIQPVGTVGATDTIPIRLRLTLDSASDPLLLSNDGGATPPFDVPLANYPTYVSSVELQNEGIYFYEFVSFDSVSNIGIGGGFGCDDTFTAGTCSGGPYKFEFDYTSPDAIFSSAFVNPVLSVAPGGSLDFSFGSFVPNGPVSAGTYYAYSFNLTLGFSGSASFRIQETDGSGNPVFDEFNEPVWLPGLRVADGYGETPIAQTSCYFSGGAGCTDAFSRTVVPAPPAAWLLGTAFGMVGWRLRRVRPCARTPT